jgi:hypothetical protein
VTEKKQGESRGGVRLADGVGEAGAGDREEEAERRELAFIVVSDGCKVELVVCMCEVLVRGERWVMRAI